MLDFCALFTAVTRRGDNSVRVKFIVLCIKPLVFSRMVQSQTAGAALFPWLKSKTVTTLLDVKVRTVFAWLKIGTSGGLLYTR